MIKLIIFDFDGVIVESVDIKTDAFKELFADYPEKINEIVQYHLENGGISRYTKFRYIYEHILRQKLSRDKQSQLGERFSQIIFKKVLSAPFVVGAKEFLAANKNRYLFFIASGAPEEELCKIIKAKGLQGYFQEIHGSPKKKVDIINEIMKKYGFARNEGVYVGDAESDRISAQECAITFIERRPNFNVNLETYPWAIKDLSSLSEILNRIESQILEV